MNERGNACCPFFDGYISNSKPNINDVNELTSKWGLTWSIKPFENELGDLKEHINPIIYNGIGSDKLANALKFFEFLEEASHVDIAERYIQMETDIRYKYCENGKNSLWLEWNSSNIVVVRNNSPPRLLYKLSKFWTKALKVHYIECVARLDPNSKEIRNIHDTYKNTNKSFGNPSYMNKVIQVLKSLLQDDKLISKLDRTPHLLAFQDGKVVDFKQGKVRKIEKEDMISNHLDYSLPEKNMELQAELTKIIWGLFENDDVYNYLLDSIGFSMITNRFEKFNVWKGIGSNGKSLLLKLVEKAFGAYFQTCSTGFLNTFKTGSTFDCDLADAVGKKILAVSEPTGSSNFNMAKIKALTGRDLQTTRNIGQGNISFKPEFTLFCLCNEIPPVERMDNATKRRMCITDFKFKFTKNPIEGTNDRLIDETLKDKLDEDKYVQQFMRLLVDRMLVKYNDDLIVPDAVKEATIEYFDDNNLVGDFINDYLQKKKTKSDDGSWNIISYAESYSLFEKHFPNSRISKQTFNKNMEDNGYRKVKKCVNNKTIRGYLGLCFKDELDDLEFISEDEDGKESIALCFRQIEY